jgi:hypothetical protein
LITRGLSPFTVALSLCTPGLSFFRGSKSVEYMSITTFGISIMARVPALSSVLLISAAILSLTFSKSRVSRSFSALCIAVLALSEAITGTIVLTIAAVAASQIGNRGFRMAIIAAGLFLTLPVVGIPRASRCATAVASEYIADDAVVWVENSALTLAIPEMVLGCACPNPGELSISISGGGVRDEEAVGVLITGEKIVPVYSGCNFMTLREVEYPVIVRLTREWKPFNHPVLHLVSAEAQNE